MITKSPIFTPEKNEKLLTRGCNGSSNKEAVLPFAEAAEYGIRTQGFAVPAPIVHAWVDSSSPPARQEFVFPSNRSSASTALPNRSSSATESVPVPCEAAVNVGANPLQRELLRVYDANAELREQTEVLKERLAEERVMRVELAREEQRWRTRCNELEELLKREQQRCSEKDETIKALRGALCEAKNMSLDRHTSCISNVWGVASDELKKLLVNNEGKSHVSSGQHVERQPIFEKDIILSKSGFAQVKQSDSDSGGGGSGSGGGAFCCDRQDAKGLLTPHGSCVPKWTRSVDSCLTAESLLHTSASGINRKTPTDGSNSFQCYLTTLAAGGDGHTALSPEQIGRHKTTGSSSTTHFSHSAVKVPSLAVARCSPQPPLCRAFVPRTLADLGAFAQASLTKSDAEPYCGGKDDSDDVRKVTLLSQTSKLKEGVSLRRVLSQNRPASSVLRVERTFSFS